MTIKVISIISVNRSIHFTRGERDKWCLPGNINTLATTLLIALLVDHIFATNTIEQWAIWRDERAHLRPGAINRAPDGT